MSSTLACAPRPSTPVGALTISDAGQSPGLGHAARPVAPGPITLGGALAAGPNTLPSQIQVSPLRPHLSTALAPNVLADLKDVASREDWVNYGCIWPVLPGAQGFKSAGIPYAPKSILRAKIVLICRGFASVQYQALRIVADKVILEDVTLDWTGPASRTLAVFANELELRGANAITTRSDVSGGTGPRVTLAARLLTGDGRLEIQTLPPKIARAR